jgi:hypothetical protein
MRFKGYVGNIGDERAEFSVEIGKVAAYLKFNPNPRRCTSFTVINAGTLT